MQPGIRCKCLSAGIDTLSDGTTQYVAGADTLADGTTTYVAGAGKLAAGAKELAKLEDGLTTVSNGISQLNTRVLPKEPMTHSH